jgi:hypothetical protein
VGVSALLPANGLKVYVLGLWLAFFLKIWEFAHVHFGFF